MISTEFQFGTIIVQNCESIIDLNDRVFKIQLFCRALAPAKFFTNFQRYSISNLLSRIITLLSEHRLLLQHKPNWHFIYSKLLVY